jgi:hypothetical protein
MSLDFDDLELPLAELASAGFVFSFAVCMPKGAPTTVSCGPRKVP